MYLHFGSVKISFYILHIRVPALFSIKNVNSDGTTEVSLQRLYIKSIDCTAICNYYSELSQSFVYIACL